MTDPHPVADDPSGIVQQMPDGGDDVLAWQSLHEWTPKEGTWAILWPGHYGPFTACWIRGRWTMCEDIDFKHATIGAEMQLPHLVTEAVPFVDRGGTTVADLRAEAGAEPVAWLAEAMFSPERVRGSHLIQKREEMEDMAASGWKITPFYATPPAAPTDNTALERDAAFKKFWEANFEWDFMEGGYENLVKKCFDAGHSAALSREAPQAVTVEECLEAINQVKAEAQADLYGAKNDFNRGAVDTIDRAYARVRALGGRT